MLDRRPPAAPRSPRWLAGGASPVDPPRAAAAHVELDDVDPEFPDLEDLVLAAALLALPSAESIRIDGCHLTDSAIVSDADVGLDVRDSVLVGVDLTGRRITGLTRAHLERCRLGGADLAEAGLRDVRIVDCVLDLGSWRLARVERVEVRGGRAEALDLTGAALVDVRIAGIDLHVTLDGARAERVDLTAARLGAVTDVRSLAGCAVSPAQAIELVPRLAAAAGIHVVDTSS